MWDKIEKQLKIKSWSMYRLAKESGVHPSNFSNIKAGRLKEMSWIKGLRFLITGDWKFGEDIVLSTLEIEQKCPKQIANYVFISFWNHNNY